MSKFVKSTIYAIAFATAATASFAGKDNGTGDISGTVNVPVVTAEAVVAVVTANDPVAVQNLAASIATSPAVATSVVIAATQVVQNLGGAANITLTQAETNAVVTLLTALAESTTLTPELQELLDSLA